MQAHLYLIKQPAKVILNPSITFFLIKINEVHGVVAKKNKKHKTKKKNDKTIKVPPIAIMGRHGNIVVAEKEVWAYYILAEKPYDFLSDNSKITLANATQSALASLSASANKPIDCHIQISNTPFNPESWEEQVRMEYAKWTDYQSEAFENFINAQRDELYNGNYMKRVSYFGVKLFNRGSFDVNNINILESSLKDTFNAFKKSIDNLLSFDNEEITSEEETRANNMEEELYRVLHNSNLQAVRPNKEDMLINIKRRFYPAMDTPYLEADYDNRIGASDIVIETGGTVDVKPRWLHITQFQNGDIREGYRATLTFSKFPLGIQYPFNFQPFMYRKEVLPFTMNARFTLIPAENMKKEVNKKKLEADDEIENLAGSGQGVNASVKNTFRDLETIETELENSKEPWIEGSYRITIEAPNEEILKDEATNLKQLFNEEDIVLTWTSGDQLQMFREEFPGGHLEINSFQQTTNLALVGVAGINFGTKVGDPVRQQTLYRRK